MIPIDTRKAFPVGSDEEWAAWLDYARYFGPDMQSLEQIRARGGLYRSDAEWLHEQVENARRRGRTLFDVSGEMRR